jgi:pimeloyl-ACP methyl ester carboxylesterase
MSSAIRATFQKRSYDVCANLRERGSDLVVFCHGLGCSKNSFLSPFAAPEFESYSLLAPDFLGFGDSAKPDTGDFSYSLEDHAAILSGVILGIPCEHIHIVAHSFGGAVALLLDPEILSKAKTFINCEGNLIGEDCGLASRGTISVSFDQFENEVLPEFKKIFPNGPGYFEFDRMSPSAFYRSAQSLVGWSDSEALLNRFLSLNCTKVFLYGAENRGMSVLQRLPGVQSVEVVNSGHFLFGENPTATYQAVLNSIEHV